MDAAHPRAGMRCSARGKMQSTASTHLPRHGDEGAEEEGAWVWQAGEARRCKLRYVGGRGTQAGTQAGGRASRARDSLHHPRARPRACLARARWEGGKAGPSRGRAAGTQEAGNCGSKGRGRGGGARQHTVRSQGVGLGGWGARCCCSGTPPPRAAPRRGPPPHAPPRARPVKPSRTHQATVSLSYVATRGGGQDVRTSKRAAVSTQQQQQRRQTSN